MITHNKNFDRTKLTYREGAIGVVIDSKNRFLIVQKKIYKENEWYFPGGGIHKGEKPEEALLRELTEELGTDKFKILKKSKVKNQYEWPQDVIQKKFLEKGRTWRGQRQILFLVAFTGEEVDIKPGKPEIRYAKWVELEELPGLFVFPGEWESAKKTIRELLPQLEK